MATTLFYWYYIIITATIGGRIYATGDWREPLEDADFGQQVEARWVIAGNDALSSVYAWPLADEGYRFVGFQDENGNIVEPARNTVKARCQWGNATRLWATAESAQTEDGIVSGNDFYPAEPIKLTAVFESDTQTSIVSTEKQNVRNSETIYDMTGRRISTPNNGQIIIRNNRKIKY